MSNSRRDDNDREISLTMARQLLGSSCDLSDVQIEQLRSGMYAIAESVVDAFARDYAGDRAQTALAKVPCSDRDSVEERAAILEFDAKLPRDTATRLALVTYIKSLDANDRSSNLP
jgi:hypothetical protein